MVTGRSESLSKKKSFAMEKKGSGSAFLMRRQRESSPNEITVALTYVRPNLVNWNRDIIFSLQWMSDMNESQPTRIETTPDLLTGATIPLDLKFSFPLESSLSPYYLTTAINNPVIINAFESTTQKSTTNSKAGHKSTGELLGQTCLDIMPLFMQIGKGGAAHQNPVDENLATKTDDKSVDTGKESEKVEEKSVVKIPKSKFHTELSLEAMDMPRGAEVLTPMNKVNIGVTTCLYLETTLPQPSNVLTIIPESVYNLPPVLSDPQYMSALNFSLGMSIPVSTPESSDSFDSFSAKSLGVADQNDLEPSPDQNVTTVTFVNGHPDTQPDLMFRSKWKLMEDQLTGPAKYTSTRLAKHIDDVKYGESVSHGATNKAHVQFNQAYRLWLTGAAEGLVREHIGAYGQWPLEILIESGRLMASPESKKATGGGGNKSAASQGGKSKTIELPLPMMLLSFVDLTDLLLPGLTRTRVLVEFPPDPPSLRLLQLRTGLTQFVFTPPEPGAASSPPKALGGASQHQSNTNTIRSPKTNAAGNKRDKKDDATTTEKLADQFHTNPMAMVIRIELARPLTEKPEQDSIVHDLLKVIRNKHLYVPDLKREEAENVRESFESAIARCTEIFYAEYDDYEKLRATGEKKSSKQLVQSREKMRDDTESTEKVDTKDMSNQRQTIGNRNRKQQTRKPIVSGDQSMYGRKDQLKDAQTSAEKTAKTYKKNEPVNPLESFKSPIKILIPDNFKKYISQSGALTKCYTILERPLRRYVRSLYALDGGDYSVEVLSEIHATLLAVMGKVVDQVACSSTQQSSGGVDRGGEECEASQDIISKLKEETAYRVRSKCSTLRIAYEYSAQKHTCDAQRLLLSRIRDHLRDGTLINSTSDNTLDGTVWSSHAQWSLRYGDQLDAAESLKQSLYLRVERNELMMMAYISYLNKEWDKADLYFTSLSNLFDNDVIAWIAMHAYHLNLGRTREAASALHMARVCLATEVHHRGSEEENEETEVEKVKPRDQQENGGTENKRKNPTDSKNHSSYKPSVKTESPNLTTLLSHELSWVIPNPRSFGDETSDNNVFLKACPVFLALNMFEFAETCIVEYELSQPSASHLASYYKAVSQYKQSRYHRSMSHLNTIPVPVSQCAPLLVLKFHNAYSLRAEESAHTDGEERSMNSSYASDSSLSISPSSTDCHRIYTSMRKQLDRPEYQSLRFLVFLRLGEIASSQAHAHLMRNNPKFVVSERRLMNDVTEAMVYDGKCMSADSRKLSREPSKQLGDSSKQLDDSKKQLDDSKKQLDDSRKQLDDSTKQLDDSSKQLDDSSKQLDDSELQILSEAEQNLLLLAHEHDSPLVWYYLGLIYLKQNRLGESELALNEANKLDPSLGNPWAGLALVNFVLRRTSLFVSCRDEARKYHADPALVEVLDKMSALMT